MLEFGDNNTAKTGSMQGEFQKDKLPNV